MLERCYAYVLEHGLASVSLRPLAAAVGSSPRVLLFLFGSKDELVRELLARARAEEIELPALGVCGCGPVGGGAGGMGVAGGRTTTAAYCGCGSRATPGR